MNLITASIVLALQWALVSRAGLCGGSGDLPLAAAVIAAMVGSGGRFLERAWALGLAVDLLSPCPTGLNSLCFLFCGHMGRWAGGRFDPNSMWVRAVVLAGAAVFTESARAASNAAQGAGTTFSHFAISTALGAALTVTVGLAWGSVADAFCPVVPAARRSF